MSFDKKSLRLGIFGATGAVGEVIRDVLKKRNFSFKSLRLFASSRSAGKVVDGLKIENVDDVDFSEIDIAFFAIGGGWAKENARKATEKGCFVIDNSSTFRYDSDVPLVIPEINPEAIGDSKLIANPNCTTAIAAIPLWHLHKNFGLKKVIISTYQATSGAGREGMNELRVQTEKYLKMETTENKYFAHSIVFNVIPHIDKFQDNDYSKEEMKVTWETQKIFNEPDLAISCTAVRVPTLRAHAESIVVETEKTITAKEAKDIFAQAKGIKMTDNINEKLYPMPINSSEKYDVRVGRIRQNIVFGSYGLEFFVCGDQLLKGAALNAVQIAELLIV